MSRVLILGGFGMLGHQLVRHLRHDHDISVTIREQATDLPTDYPPVDVIGDTNLRHLDRIRSMLENRRWDVVINAAGVIKHRIDQDGAGEAIAINALLPRELASTCARLGIRLIHFSTDCVFSGMRTSARGSNGYRIGDLTDARDDYGLSKRLGEPDLPGCLCIRTSLVGPEVRGHHGLMDWYLRQPEKQVPGYTRAFFNGLTTPVAARLIDILIREHPTLDGLWHVSSAPITKFTFLSLVHNLFRRGPDIIPEDHFFCDRRLDGTAFQSRTGWTAPDWADMVGELAESEHE